MSAHRAAEERPNGIDGPQICAHCLDLWPCEASELEARIQTLEEKLSSLIYLLTATGSCDSCARRSGHEPSCRVGAAEHALAGEDNKDEL
jgi:hypothetical protein